jgi:hypothetical protein
MTRPTDNPRTTRDVLSPARGVTSVEAVDELNASDPVCCECADLGDLVGSGTFCFVCGQGDLTRGGS